MQHVIGYAGLTVSLPLLVAICVRWALELLRMPAPPQLPPDPIDAEVAEFRAEIDAYEAAPS